MNKIMECHTKRIGRDALISYVRDFISYFKYIGETSCSVVLGWSWALTYYEKDWLPIEVNLDNLLSFITKIESRGIGKIGKEDLYISIRQIEFKLCHEGDIHMKFSEKSEATEYFFSKWKSVGYEPVWIQRQ